MQDADRDNGIENRPDAPPAESRVRNCWHKLVYWYDQLVQWFDDNERAELLKEMRGMLSLVSTMIATMTFQFALNPPGGVFPVGDDHTVEQLLNCKYNESLPCAGQAVLAIISNYGYILFQTYNTISFMSSLSVSLLLVSGIPLLNKFVMWILSIGMIITVTFVALTFLQGMLLINPGDGPWLFATIKTSIYTWTGLVGMVGLFLIIRFLVWVVKKFIDVYKRKRQQLGRLLKM